MNSSDLGQISVSPDVSSSLFEAITRIRRAMRLKVRELLSQEDFPLAQVEFLQRLADEPGLRLGELAHKHSMPTNTVSITIQQMVVKGLVSRETDPTDRRAVTLHLTDTGHSAVTAWRRANAELLEAALARVSPTHATELASAVDAIHALAEELDKN